MYLHLKSTAVALQKKKWLQEKPFLTAWLRYCQPICGMGVGDIFLSFKINFVFTLRGVKFSLTGF